MSLIVMFLMVLGLVLFFLAALGTPSSPRFALTPAGLFCWLLAELLTRAPLGR